MFKCNTHVNFYCLILKGSIVTVCVLFALISVCLTLFTQSDLYLLDFSQSLHNEEAQWEGV